LNKVILVTELWLCVSGKPGLIVCLQDVNVNYGIGRTFFLQKPEGFRRWRGSILVLQRNPYVHVSCSIPKHCGISDRSEQNSSKLRHTVCDFFISYSAAVTKLWWKKILTLFSVKQFLTNC